MTVIRPDMGNQKGVGVWAFSLALLTAGALAHVAVRMHGIQIAYDLGRERRTNTELEERRRRLNIEIGMLKDPGRVISIARDKLQMGPPAPGDVVRLDPGVLLKRGDRPAPSASVFSARASGASASPLSPAGQRGKAASSSRSRAADGELPTAGDRP